MKKEVTDTLVILIYPLVFVMFMAVFLTRGPMPVTPHEMERIKEEVKNELKPELIEQLKNESLQVRSLFADELHAKCPVNS